jgi:hypothetical protein
MSIHKMHFRCTQKDMHSELDYLFGAHYFEWFYLTHFKPKWRFVNGYKGARWKGQLEPLKFQGWKWWEMGHTLSKSLSVHSPTYLPYNPTWKGHLELGLRFFFLMCLGIAGRNGWIPWNDTTIVPLSFRCFLGEYLFRFHFPTPTVK